MADQEYLASFGVQIDEGGVFRLQSVLTFLGLIGVIVDPTTAGLEDSVRAMGYEEPYHDPEP